MRDAGLADLDALIELEQACYPSAEAYDREQYRYALARAKAINLVHEEAGRAVGFVGAFHHAGHRIGHVYTLQVHPKERGRGLGRALMAACEDRLRALGMERVMLEVKVDNVPALALYERAGYERSQLLRGYYVGHRVRDAWLCVKEL